MPLIDSQALQVQQAQADLFQSLGLSSDEPKVKANDPTDLGLDTFLKLMITQMNNQDPFKPMENGEFLGQIAQFASVSGLDKLNGSFTDLSSSLTSGQALQAGGLVGREVLAPIGTGFLQTGSTIRGQVDLEGSSSEVNVRVTDQVGQLVRNLPLGAAGSGPLNFSWDGLGDDGQFAPEGLYNIEVTSVQSGQNVELQTQLFSQVESVSLGGGGLTLNLAGLGPISFDNVKQIY